jgi:endonuclease/exonuclease/phosphatase family metal-dependent hydrolase
MFAPLHLLTTVPATVVVVAAIVQRRALWTLTPALVITAAPVAGLCVPWTRLQADIRGGPRLRVLTCNMHHTRIPPGPLDRVIREIGSDVVALQECRNSTRIPELSQPGWHTHTLPGLFLASRYPIRKAERGGADSTGPHGSFARYELETPAGIVTLFSVHLATPREGLAEVVRGDAGGLDGLGANSELRWVQSRHLATEAGRTTGPVLVVGDFNTPPQSAIFRDVWDGYADAFGSAGWGWGHTFAARMSSVRIDHILVGRRGKALRCWVGPDVGSPHRPVIADLAWPADAPPRP